jgi:hypothetical protein
MCWYPDSLKVNNAADRIPSEDNRRPHLVAPVCFVADSQNNRVCRVEFDARAHGAPPKVSEFVLAADAWDCVNWGNKLIVSERGAHRIAQYDMATGAFERVIVQGEPLATVGWNRFVKRYETLAAIRAQDVVQPEGLYVVDDWLYYASAAMAQIKRVHLVDGRIEVVVNTSSSNTPENFLKIAVSNGTAGPKHAVYVTNWTVGDFGAPKCYLPMGGTWRVNPYNSRNLHRGKGGGGFSSIGYSGAVAAKSGRIVYGSSFEGLRQASLAAPSDGAIDRSAYARGRSRWVDLGYHLKYGEHAQSRFGEPLPRGEDPDMDAFIEACERT